MQTQQRAAVERIFPGGEFEVSRGSALNLDETHYGIFECLKGEKRRLDFFWFVKMFHFVFSSKAADRGGVSPQRSTPC